jgi:hypothetical protein
VSRRPAGERAERPDVRRGAALCGFPFRPQLRVHLRGLADEIITDLCRLRALRVIARGSLIHYSGTTKLTQIALRAGVQFVLTRACGWPASDCASRRSWSAPPRIAPSEWTTWTARWPTSSIFEEKVARSVAAELRVQISPAESGALRAAHHSERARLRMHPYDRGRSHRARRECFNCGSRKKCIASATRPVLVFCGFFIFHLTVCFARGRIPHLSVENRLTARSYGRGTRADRGRSTRIPWAHRSASLHD